MHQVYSSEAAEYKDREWLRFQIWELGKSKKYLANEYKLGETTIRYWYNKKYKYNNLKYQKYYRESTKTSEESRKDCQIYFMKLYKDRNWLLTQINVFGKSQREVAKECGVVESVITYWYNESSKENSRKYHIKWHNDNINEIKDKGKKYRSKNKKIISEKGKQKHRDIKIQVFNILGGCKCQLCDVTDIDKLNVDHIDGTGYEDKRNGYEGPKLYRSIVNRTYPRSLSNLRVLCWNHNLARTREYLDLPPEKQTKGQKHKTKLWKEALEFFGPCPCGITELKFLTISHIHNDGAERRRSGEPKAHGLLGRFRQLGYPQSLKNDYRLECANCNCSRRAEEEE